MLQSGKLVFATAAALAAWVPMAAFPGSGPLRAEQASGANLSKFVNGLPTNPNFFPIAVWLQQPKNARAFKAIGVNTFVGLWHPPTAEGLAQFEREGIHLVLEQTPAALTLKHSPAIRGWLQADEPDNAQPDGRGGHGECVPPEEVVRRYAEIRSRDPTRPVYLGFGQGVANPFWYGRGAKCSAMPPEAYYRIASQGADIVAFDIYPVAEVRQTHVIGRLDLVGRGVANLKRWVPPGTPIWADIETTHIYNPERRPLPAEIYSEVWIAIILGANGINYFVHEWKPSFREDGVFRYPDVVAEIAKINAQLNTFAPVLNSASVPNGIGIQAATEISAIVKSDGGTTYIFAANMEKTKATARLTLPDRINGQVLVLGEDRSMTLVGGAFEDTFEPYGIHLYQLRAE